ncbi:phage integrase family protein [Lysobacter capsici]|uniref:site-specific integrase n=1 Tax=Lysobacter capsici TaxID=435897 RepID=UPI0007165958|nr:site-specific integrase [Lysobacter capsici]ALN84414.1 phage integrase family protein [Lysobacter capsici]
MTYHACIHSEDASMGYANETTQRIMAAGLKIGSIKVNNVVLQDIEVAGAADVVNLQELVSNTLKLTRRRRYSKDGTRYPEPLPVGSSARKLSIEIRDYLGYRDTRGLADSTRYASKRALDLLFSVCGDIYVSSITHAHIYKLWELIRWTPDSRASAEILAVRSADDLIAEGKALNLRSPAIDTFRLYRRQLRTFFRSLVGTGTLGHSPMAAFDEMKGSLIEDPDKAERLFDSAELERIFDPIGFTQWAKAWPHRWWCPILGLHMGLRVGEAAQLKLANVIQDEGLWCIDIRATVDKARRDLPGRKSTQRLKGRSAIRCLPIPQAVLDAGFLDFVADIREAGRNRLFPNLTAGTKNDGETKANYGACFSRQFTGYMADLGFQKGVRFHAFRHTLVTDLKQQGFQDRDIALITGHATAQERVETIKRHYDHQTSPKRRRTKPVLRDWQLEVLEAYRPSVQLPRYQRGQFWSCLKWEGLVHP